MIKSLLIRSIPSPLLIETKDVNRSSKRVVSSIITCSSSINNNAFNVPKLDPFSRTKIERAVKSPPLIEKSENELADYCSTLEGDDSYSCWRAYFELKDLERESPKDEVEKLIIQSGGVKTLIGCLHGISSMHKGKKNAFNMAAPPNVMKERVRRCPIPDGLPKSLEELEEEERARMPDSPFTRMLRTKGRFPCLVLSCPGPRNRLINKLCRAACLV
ncbi:CCG-BINDING PROTEIN 1 [Salix koriyanagi]|uniref:CCG-BINDING PROTEIN 1 n=1 Tax=Salix koriyanagi TaxID=2511006 RepID=A0A9Q0TS88_9ROSI|nr:CCG-BINDING PROTEIN 1 [Salix koriyanagi]